jgi:hypothetical protein
LRAFSEPEDPLSPQEAEDRLTERIVVVDRLW